jgi:hypothetical protein
MRWKHSWTARGSRAPATGPRTGCDKFWTWVFRAELYVLFKIDKSRGSKVLLDVLGEEFNGVLGCDYFSAYHKYMKDFNITVQFCVAHLIRDIKYLTGLEDPDTKAYGTRLLAAVKAMFKVIHSREHLAAGAFDQAMAQARENIMRAALNDVPSRLDAKGKEQKREAFNMANRFRLTSPAPPPPGCRADRIVRAERRVRVSGSSTCNRASVGLKCWGEVQVRSVSTLKRTLNRFLNRHPSSDTLNRFDLIGAKGDSSSHDGVGITCPLRKSCFYTP